MELFEGLKTYGEDDEGNSFYHLDDVHKILKGKKLLRGVSANSPRYVLEFFEIPADEVYFYILRKGFHRNGVNKC
jgi:hypothetical protein